MKNKEYQRGYESAKEIIERGVNAQTIFEDSYFTMDNSTDFDRGWQQLCLEKGAKYDKGSNPMFDAFLNQQKVGEDLMLYCKKYEGTDKYNDVMLAIEFGMSLYQKYYGEE